MLLLGGGEVEGEVVGIGGEVEAATTSASSVAAAEGAAALATLRRGTEHVCCCFCRRGRRGVAPRSSGDAARAPRIAERFRMGERNKKSARVFFVCVSENSISFFDHLRAKQTSAVSSSFSLSSNLCFFSHQVFLKKLTSWDGTSK